MWKKRQTLISEEEMEKKNRNMSSAHSALLVLMLNKAELKLIISLDKNEYLVIIYNEYPQHFFVKK